MPTEAQLKAADDVTEAVRTLNKALSAASDSGIHVELHTFQLVNLVNEQYAIGAMETRESMLKPVRWL